MKKDRNDDESGGRNPPTPAPSIPRLSLRDGGCYTQKDDMGIGDECGYVTADSQ